MSTLSIVVSLLLLMFLAYRGYTVLLLAPLMAALAVILSGDMVLLLPIYTVLVNMDKSYLEASADLGGNTVVTFFKVTLPLSAGGIISGATMVFMPVFSAYAITGMLGDARTNVFGARINALFSNSSTWGVGRW